MFGIGKSSSTGGKVGRAAKPGDKVNRTGIPATTPTTGTRVVGRKPSKSRKPGS